MANTIAFFSTKGGTGKTFLAMNLAVALAASLQKKVLLIDLDTQGTGDVVRLFNISAHKSMVDLVDGLKKSREEVTLKNYITPIESSGIDILPAALTPQQAAQLSPAGIKDAINFLGQHYDHIIIDTGKGISESLVAALNSTNLIFLVVTPDVLSVYQAKWALGILQSMHVPLNMIKTILNRTESAGAVSWQDVRTAIESEIISRVPSEGKIVGLALNRNIPVVIDSPKSKVSLAIIKLAQTLVESPQLFLSFQDVSGKALGEGAVYKDGEIWQKLKLIKEGSSAVYGQRDIEDEITQLKKRIYQKLIEKIDLKHVQLDISDPVKAAKIREKSEAVISTALAEETGIFLSSFEIRRKLVKEIADEALGLGALEDLVSDPDISDIMVNNKNQIYVERHGKLELTTKKFMTNDQVRQVIERIISPLGRRIDESVPMVDARLPDGSRVNAIIPPLALTGPTLTIRKFGLERLTADNLVSLDTLSQQMLDFLKASIRVRKNMVVSGGTGSGKTTVLNILSMFIPDNERIITIEDAAELRLGQDHWVRLESRPANIEGRGAIGIRDLFRNALRMRPDRIIIGECRGEETLDMLQAMNTGHDGSMTTIHANSTHDVLARLDSMILMAGVELPIRAIREMIASAIHVIVHTARLSDGTRKITQVSEVTGMKDDIHIGLQDIFYFKQTGFEAGGKVKGEFMATGYVPSYINEIKVKGIPLPEDIFRSG